MKHKKRSAVIPVGFVDWMDGYCSAFDDFPDGAWQAAGEDAVTAYNHEYKTNIDPYEGWLHWATSRSA